MCILHPLKICPIHSYRQGRSKANLTSALNVVLTAIYQAVLFDQVCRLMGIIRRAIKISNYQLVLLEVGNRIFR